MSSVLAPHRPLSPSSLLGRPFRWVQQARDRRRSRLLEQSFREARLALGRQMYAAGIDDGETGAMIAAVAAELASAAPPAVAELEARRNRLYIRLADAALEDDAPLPGADAEFAQALDLKRAIEVESAAHALGF